MFTKFLPISSTFSPTLSSESISTRLIFVYGAIPSYLRRLPSTLNLFCDSRCAFPLSRSFFLYKHHSSLFPIRCSPNVQPEQSDCLAEAVAAVSEFLRDCGAAEEQSFSIASNCPQYVRMLVDGVRELDETSMWRLWNSEGKECLGNDVGLKEKLILMAREKGDNGKVAFLESLGLSLSSAIHVARYLSGETLPHLVKKVEFMKEILFSGNTDGRLIGKSARRMMMYLSIPLAEDIQQTLSFFEKIEARRGGLDMLGSDDTSLRYLIESFPRLLLLSEKSDIKPLVDFLEYIGVPGGCIGNIFLLFPPIIFSTTEVIKTRVKFFKEFGVEDTKVGKVLLKYPWTLSKGIHNNYKEILSYLEYEKVPRASIDRAVQSWPLLLGSSTDKLKVMVSQLGELDVRSEKLGKVIATSPQLLLQKPQQFLEVVSFLEALGFDRETVRKVLVRCPEIFATNVESTLKRKLAFLKSIGVSRAHLLRVIKKYPELLVCDPDRIRPRMKYLIETGLSKTDVAFMVRRFSPLLGYSIEEVLKPKMEFLLKTMGKPLKEVVDYPRYFSYSLEKKIEPRFRMLQAKELQWSLKDMLGKNDEEFAAEIMLHHSPSSPE